ncbi:MAG: TIR domain-containing protein [Elainellaceae cyanobacterium]
MANIFISYRSVEPDAGLAQTLYRALTQTGHDAFLAAESIQFGEDWSDRVDEELERCDYFVLLLSAQAAESDMVREEVRRSRELRQRRERAGEKKCPVILPVRVQFPRSAPLGYALRSYLEPLQQLNWESVEDTPGIVQQIFGAIQSGQLENTQANDVITPKPTLKPVSNARRDRYGKRLAIKQEELATVDAQLEETSSLVDERKLEVRAERLLGEIEELEQKLNALSANS